MKKLLLLAIVVLGISAVSFGQQGSDTEQGTATAKIIAPITLGKDLDMSFGAIAKSLLGGTVELNATTGNRTATGVTLGINTGVQAAKFTVSGEGSALYIVTLPANDVVTLAGPSGSTAMKVQNFTKSAAGTIESGGTQSFFVGATLHLNANQASGDYTGTFNVTVAYN